MSERHYEVIRHRGADCPDAELLSAFVDLRLVLSERGLMEYREDDKTKFGDDIYLKLNEVEKELRNRIFVKNYK